MKKTALFFIFLLLMLFFTVSVYAFDVVPSKEYAFPDESELPAVLNVGVPVECGDLKIQLYMQPVVTKSMNSIVADNDMKYMIIRVGITNIGEETIGWLTPDSFVLSEYYRNREYGKTFLNSLMSAKIAPGFTLKAFYTPIAAGKMVIMPLVFDVYGEADGWILTFAPHTFGETAADEVRFRLPKALFQ